MKIGISINKFTPNNIENDGYGVLIIYAIQLITRSSFYCVDHYFYTFMKILDSLLLCLILNVIRCTFREKVIVQSQAVFTMFYEFLFKFAYSKHKAV